MKALSYWKTKTWQLSVLDDEEYSFTVVMNHVFIDAKLYFHCAKQGHNIDAID